MATHASAAPAALKRQRTASFRGAALVRRTSATQTGYETPPTPPSQGGPLGFPPRLDDGASLPPPRPLDGGGKPGGPSRESGATRFRMRAECVADAMHFYRLLVERRARRLHEFTLRPDVLGEADDVVEVEFLAAYSLSEARALARCVDGDFTMRETLDYADCYTGERCNVSDGEDSDGDSDGDGAGPARC